MKNKKADISMNMIVYIAIALLVLVLIVAFVTGGFGAMFKGLARTAPQDLETIQATCTSDCNKVKTTVETQGTAAWESSKYCKNKRGYDLDQSGDVSQDEYKYCWEAPISIDCTTTTEAYDEETGEEEIITCGSDALDYEDCYCIE